MISNCPHCQGALKFNAAQLGKIGQALKALKPGQRLPLKCPHCAKPMNLDAQGNAEGAAKAAAPAPAAAKAPEPAEVVKPPPPPSLEWLKNQKDDEGILGGGARDVPMALVLHEDDNMRHLVKSSMEALGYQTVSVNSAEEAVHEANATSYASIIYHAGFEPGGLKESIFHEYMRKMPMSRRRMIYYILMGPDFISLYDIQALANSANLVIADKDMKDFQPILHKAIPYYEQLFGPLLEELTSYGK
jgi:CheY-like chemotaxis protein